MTPPHTSAPTNGTGTSNAAARVQARGKARYYGVSTTVIGHIRDGKLWSHVVLARFVERSIADAVQLPLIGAAL